jgi:hypothetical protein
MRTVPRFGFLCLALLAIMASALAAAPANDNFANRISLPSSACAATVSNWDATAEAGEPAFLTGGKSVWWSWKAPAAGSVTITTTGSDFEALLAVYTGTGTTLATLTATTVATNHTAGVALSKVTFTAVKDTIYQIGLDSASANPFTATLEISLGTSLATINSQPASTGVATGQTMSFGTVASASGSLTLTYQWYQNGILLVDGTQSVPPIAGEIISGATTPTLTAANVQLGSSGTYVYVVISNSDGTGAVTTSPATFTVFESSAFVDTPPVSQAVTAGGTATFTVVAEGGPLPAFQWRKGGVPLTGGLQASGSTVSASAAFDANAHTTTSTLTISNANNNSTGDAGTYDVVVTNTTSGTLNTVIAPTTPTQAAAVLTINKASQAAPTVYATGAMTFGSFYQATTNQGAGATVWSLGVINTSTATNPAVGASTGVVTSSSIGTVWIRANFAGDSNHNPSTYSSEVKVTVSAAPTTFALSSANFTYNGAPQGPTINPTPSAATFTSGGTLTATNAGNYNATATATGNYTGTNNSLGWTIAKAAQATVTVTSSASGTFNTPYTATASGGSGAGSISWALGTGSTAPGAAINPTSGAVTSTGAGTVVIVATRATDTNYLAGSSANFTITLAKSAQAALSVNSSAAGTYGSAYTATTTGGSGTGTVSWALAGGSTAPGAAINSSTGAVTSTGAGTVVFNATKAADANYLSLASSNFTVTLAKAALTVTANNATRPVNTANPAFTVNYSGFAYSDNASSLTTQPTASTTATISSPVGTYPITPAGGVSPNYTFTYVNGTLTVLRVASGDFSADGKSDILWGNVVNGDHYVWLMNGGTIATNVFLATVAPQWITATGDFNADGKADILWSNTSNGDRYVWLMNGGTVTSSVFLATVAPQWTAQTGDFNADGKADILWSNSSSGDRYVWLMNGGTVTSSVFLATVAPQWTAQVGDFNGDGKADILWSNTSSGDRYLWLMNGGTVTSSVFLATIAPQWTSLVGDFNGDGKADILWSNTSSGDRYVWLMNGGTVTTNIFLTTIAPQWTPTTGDFNGDGMADLVWSNTASGDRYIWLMNGGTVTSSFFLGTLSPDWHISP